MYSPGSELEETERDDCLQSFEVNVSIVSEILMLVVLMRYLKTCLVVTVCLGDMKMGERGNIGLCV